MKRTAPRELKRIEIDHAGERHSGAFEIDGKNVKLTSIYGSKATQIRGASPELLAKTMLGELVKARST